MKLEMMMTCYNVSGEPDDEDNPRAIEIPKLEEIRDIAALELLEDKFKQLLKLKKVNIGTIESPKFSRIGYY